jgi:ATP synthase F1 delta subunit
MQRSILASRYAVAHLNIFGKLYTREHVQLIEQLLHYFQAHKEALFYLKLSCIKPSVKKSILINICARYGLRDDFNELFDLLITHKRLFMIIDVLYALVRTYKERNAIVEWVVKSAIVLQPTDVGVIYQFLEKKTGMRAEYTSVIDKKLVAGIRVQSTTLLWEYSVRQQLKRIRAV